MRKLNLISGAFGIAVIGLTACSNEMPGNNDVAQKDEYRYMRVAMSSPATAGTRAGDNDFQ